MTLLAEPVVQRSRRPIVGQLKLGWRRRAITILLVAALVGIWQLIVSSGAVSRLVIAAPSDIASALVHSPGQFFGQFVGTAIEVLIAGSIVGSVGVSFGALIAQSSLLYEAFMPMLTALFAVPWVILYPLFMVWFGLGSTSKILFAFIAAIGPVTTAAASSVRSVDRNFAHVARAYGATRRQLVQKVLVPASLPGVIAGLRLGLALVIIIVIVAQMLGSVSGLGYLISYYRTLLDTGQVYLGIALALVLAWCGSRAMRELERHFGETDR